MAEMQGRGEKPDRHETQAHRHDQNSEGETRRGPMRRTGERGKRQEAVTRSRERAEDDHGIGRMQGSQAPSTRSTQAKKLSTSEPSPCPIGSSSRAASLPGGAPRRGLGGRYLLTGR